MAKKGKAKISKVKRNNQTTNKMKKQGKLKLQRHKQKVQKQKQPIQPQIEYSDSESDASGEEWADMLDDEEQQYIMNRLMKQPRLLANVPEKDEENKHGKKRKKIEKGKPERPPKQTLNSDSGAESESDSNSELEDKYEQELSERPAKKMRPLLPIKTKHGLQERAEECEDTESENENEPPTKPSPKPAEDQEDSDSGLDGTPDEDIAEDGIVTTVQLLAARRDRLRHEKLRIGALCSSLLESPEKKLKNLYPILYLMEERLKDGALNLLSVRKLATLSAYEVFKDILPDYKIRHQDYANVKLKKETLALYKYEKELLEFYKRFLQRLEKAASVLRRKKGDTRRPDAATTSLGLVSLRCMCGMLTARAEFNFATNIAQSVVPFLDSRLSAAQELVSRCCSEVFRGDQRGEITYTIVRLINQLVKRRGAALQPAALDCLLALRIADVQLDADADVGHKKKLGEKHKKRIINLSKKEKKRAKKLKEVERELLETQAQESQVARRKQLTEVTKTVFHIYFRLLKSAPNSSLLSAALDGIAKFTHVINLEYYTDLVSHLARLLSSEQVCARSRLQCARTALSVLAGTGDALNVDPARFHQYLYSAALSVHAGSTCPDAKIVIEGVSHLCSRARRVSASVLQAFAKRLATLALQLPHNAAIACLVLLLQLAQQSTPVSSLLEADGEPPSAGVFDPLSPSPEHCGAGAARLAELALLARSYHPTLRAVAKAALAQDRTLPAELHKMSPSQILQQYDGSTMSFKPSVPPPKPAQKSSESTHAHVVWTLKTLKEQCENIENSVDMKINFVSS